MKSHHERIPNLPGSRFPEAFSQKTDQILDLPRNTHQNHRKILF